MAEQKPMHLIAKSIVRDYIREHLDKTDSVQDFEVFIENRCIKEE